MVSNGNVEKSRIKRNCFFYRCGMVGLKLRIRTFLTGGTGGPGRGPCGKTSIYYIMAMGFNKERLRKIGIAGFLFFLLKGLVWLLLFMLAWSEL